MERKIDNVNKDIARHFGFIAWRLKDCFNTSNFFETLIIGVAEEFRVPFVWLSLINEEKNDDLIAAVQASPILRDKLNLISRDYYEKIIATGGKPLLVNNRLKPYFRLFPRGQSYLVRSMVIVPLQINGEIIGSWISADVSSNRYEPAMQTDFLQKFTKFVSNCLSQIR